VQAPLVASILRGWERNTPTVSYRIILARATDGRSSQHNFEELENIPSRLHNLARCEGVKGCFAALKLQILVGQNRLKPLTQAELRKIHDIKRTFGARIAE